MLSAANAGRLSRAITSIFTFVVPCRGRSRRAPRGDGACQSPRAACGQSAASRHAGVLRASRRHPFRATPNGCRARGMPPRRLYCHVRRIVATPRAWLETGDKAGDSLVYLRRYRALNATSRAMRGRSGARCYGADGIPLYTGYILPALAAKYNKVFAVSRALYCNV